MRGATCWFRGLWNFSSIFQWSDTLGEGNSDPPKSRFCQIGRRDGQENIGLWISLIPVRKLTERSLGTATVSPRPVQAASCVRAKQYSAFEK